MANPFTPTLRLCSVFAIAAALSFAPPPACGQFEDTEAAIILDAPLVRTGVGAGEQTRGYTFRLEEPRTLTHLGLFSYNGEDSATAPRQIGVWDADGVLVAEVTIPVGGGVIEDLGSGSKFIYAELEATVVLRPDVEYTAGVWYSQDNSPGLAFEVGFTTIEGFEYLATVETGPPGGEFAQPTIVRDDRLNAYIGPNLRFDLEIPVLEPFEFNEISFDPASGMLTLTWDSKEGKVYDLLSSTDLSFSRESWAVFDGLEDIAATLPENILSLAMPDEAIRFFAVRERVPPPTVFLQDDFEGADLWAAGSEGEAGTAWELGTPTELFEPVGAASGTNCYGTNIGAMYAPLADVRLRSPVIDLTEATTATLTYQQVIDTDLTADSGSIRVLDADNGDALLVVAASGIEGIVGDWTEVSIDLSVEALGKNVRLEFRFESDSAENFGGWYIDDVLVTGR